MKSKLFKAAAVAALLSMSAVAALAQGQDTSPLKIGYISSERVMRESNLAKAAQLKLETEFGKRDKDLKDAEAKLAAMADKLEKDAPTLSEAERNRRTLDITTQNRDLQRKRREWQEDLTQRKNEETQAVFDRAGRVVKQIFETEKYDLIIQDAPYVSARVDITKKVIDALNAQK